MDSVNVWNMDVSEGMAIMASNYSIIYKGSQWAMYKGRDEQHPLRTLVNAMVVYMGGME